MAITHSADVQVSFPLHVTLVEELLHQPVDPFLVDVQGLGGVPQV